MPSVKTTTDFPVPPAAQPLAPMDMKQVFDNQISKAAAALGGTVASVNVEEPAKEKTEYTYPVDVDDKKRYIRSLLSKEKFVKNYGLFGSNVLVTFQTRTAQDAEDIKTLPEEARYRAKLLRSIVSLNIGGNDTHGLLDDLDDVLYSAVCKMFNDFERLCDEMFRRANDPDFWTGTGGRA